MDRERYNRVRERSDKISVLMGQYLLKGYRMLGSCCEKCDTVLLKFRDQPEYCVGCQEVDVIMSDLQQEASKLPADLSKPAKQVPTEKPLEENKLQQLNQTPQQVVIPSVDAVMKSDSVAAAINSLNEKILWASRALTDCNSIEESIHYCELLKSCAEAITALRDVER